MKTLKVSDYAHGELTRLLGELMAQTGKSQTFSDVVETLVSRSVVLPPELLKNVDEFVEANKQLGYTTREEFVREAATEAIRRPFGKRTRQPRQMGNNDQEPNRRTQRTTKVALNTHIQNIKKGN